MNNQKKILPVLLTAGVALTTMSGVVNAEANPFASHELTTGYQLAETNAGLKAEGRCGEAKCGANASDKIDVADKPRGPTAASGLKAEGRCGEGKCGANAADKLKIADEPGTAPDVGFTNEVKNQ